MLKKIEQIVREEQDRAGALEVLMPTIQPADLWRKSGRYDAYGKEMLRIKDRHDRDMLYGPTNEEMITDIFRQGVQSYKDLPRNLYHIQWKFRDEVRPRFGVMRGREFLMKDAYSFDVSREAGQHSYNKMFVCYLRTFARMGLKAVPMRAETGPIGGKDSHEFLILADTGESAGLLRPRFLRHGLEQRSISTMTMWMRVAKVVDDFTSKYAATDDKHDAGGIRATVPSAAQADRARHRSGPHLFLRHEIFRAAGLRSAGAGRQEGAGAIGLLRHRRVAARRAASSRRAMTTPASSGRNRWRPSRWG